MSGYYYYDVPAEDVFTGVFGVAYMVIMLFSMALSLGVYIMSAVGQYKMSQKCGIDKPWLAFIPVASAYNLGLIAEKYDDGKPTSKKYSKILLGLNIAFIAGSVVFFAVAMIFAVIGMFSTVGGEEAFAVAGVGFILIFLLLYLLFFALAMVAVVFNYIALYRVYRIFAPDNAVLFLVLSIFVSIAHPILMLVLSSKEPVLMRRDYYYAPYNGGYNGN